MITQAKAIRRAYFNDREAPVTFDTCSNISTIEYDDPKHNKIIKVGRRIKVNHLCKEHDKVPRKPVCVHNKKVAPVLLVRHAKRSKIDQPDTQEDACYNTKGDKTPEQKLLEDEENDTTKDTTMNKRKPAMGVVENIQDKEDDDHETMGNCGKKDNKPKTATPSTQTYINEIGAYKDEDEEDKLKPVIRSFIDTNNSLSNMRSERDIPEKAEVDIKDDTDNNEEYNEGSGDHGTNISIDIDEPTKGAKMSDQVREDIEIESRGTAPRYKVVDDNINDDSRTPKDAIRKDDRLTDKTVDRWYKLVDDNINDDSRTPKDTTRKDDWDAEPTEKAVQAADRSLLDRAGNNVKELNKKMHIVKTWDPKTVFKQNLEETDQGPGKVCSRLILRNLKMS